jgi:hypothetical protein
VKPALYRERRGAASATVARRRRRLAQGEHRVGEQVERPEEAGLQPDHPFVALDRAIAGRQVEMDVPGKVDDDAGKIDDQDQPRDEEGAAG